MRTEVGSPRPFAAPLLSAVPPATLPRVVLTAHRSTQWDTDPLGEVPTRYLVGGIEVPTRSQRGGTSSRPRWDLVGTSLGRGEVPHWDLARYLILRSRRGTSFVPFAARRGRFAAAAHAHRTRMQALVLRNAETFACMRARQARANIKSKPLYPLHAPPSRRASQPRCGLLIARRGS